MGTERLVVPADWPAPPGVQAYTTTRQGGHSTGPWASFNLGARCGDQPDAVEANRRLLALDLPDRPAWLHQVHGTQVTYLAAAGPARIEPEADAAWTDQPGVVCAVLTADCLPVVLTDRAGTRVAVAHAGWRGLCHGVLEATVAALQVDPCDLLAWLGPAIGQAAFEVGPEVREAFVVRDAPAAAAFRPGRADRWHADLNRLARQRLGALGLTSVFGGHWCTYDQADQFFSFRRDGTTGRMATVAWIAPKV